MWRHPIWTETRSAISLHFMTLTARDRWLCAAVLGAGVAAGAALAQLRFSRKLARDPAGRELESPPSGEVLQVVSADGTELHAEAFGPPDGIPVVLAHGWTETLTYWVYVI